MHAYSSLVVPLVYDTMDLEKIAYRYVVCALTHGLSGSASIRDAPVVCPDVPRHSI